MRGASGNGVRKPGLHAPNEGCRIRRDADLPTICFRFRLVFLPGNELVPVVSETFAAGDAEVSGLELLHHAGDRRTRKARNSCGRHCEEECPESKYRRPFPTTSWVHERLREVSTSRSAYLTRIEPIISLRQVTSLCCGCNVALAARARVCQPLGSVTVGEGFKERNYGKFFPMA